MGLVADSLDMFADSIVYGLALFVVGKALFQKRKIARISGYLQLLLAVFGFVEVIRRFLGYGDTPNFRTMITCFIIGACRKCCNTLFTTKTKNQRSTH